MADSPTMGIANDLGTVLGVEVHTWIENGRVVEFYVLGEPDLSVVNDEEKLNDVAGRWGFEYDSWEDFENRDKDDLVDLGISPDDEDGYVLKFYKKESMSESRQMRSAQLIAESRKKIERALKR